MESNNSEESKLLYKTTEWYEFRLKDAMRLEALVLSFSRKFKDDLSKNMIDKYNDYFGITKVTEGKV